jgi:hypothetical protein
MSDLSSEEEGHYQWMVGDSLAPFVGTDRDDINLMLSFAGILIFVPIHV